MTQVAQSKNYRKLKKLKLEIQVEYSLTKSDRIISADELNVLNQLALREDSLVGLLGSLGVSHGHEATIWLTLAEAASKQIAGGALGVGDAHQLIVQVFDL